MAEILAVVPHFPSPAESADGQANYLTQLVPVLAAELRGNLRVLAIQFGDQALEEHGEGWTVERIPPPHSLDDVFALYLPGSMRPALDALHRAAVAHARAMGAETPVWCHGYETGAIVSTLAAAGHRVVAVPHYSVGVETLHDLALGDDRTRAEAFDSPWATRIGQVWPQALRPAGVRWASRLGRWGKDLPLPSAIQAQFAKLDLERQMVAQATQLVAVGPSFEAEINALYPCTVGRSRSVIAGFPKSAETPAWPWPIADHKRRVLMVGRPTGQKGWDYAAAAFSALSPVESAPIELVLIGGLGTGSGPYSQYSQRVAQAFTELDHVAVHNAGALPHDETLSHMLAADLLLFPSVFEPLGLVLLEAMSHGCCILASDAAGPSDVIQPPWGQLIPFGEPRRRTDEITDGLRAFLKLDRESMTQQQKQAKTAAEGRSWSGCAKVHLEALMGS
jgi:glycosyltransferase involved in cell wall biosynthesis